jgi:hypothetical protein
MVFCSRYANQEAGLIKVIVKSAKLMPPPKGKKSEKLSLS